MPDSPDDDRARRDLAAALSKPAAAWSNDEAYIASLVVEAHGGSLPPEFITLPDKLQDYGWQG